MHTHANNQHFTYLSTLYPTDKLSLLTDTELVELYSKSQPKKVKIGDLKDTPIDSYLINSVDGFVPAHEWRNKGVKDCVTLTTVTGKTVTASVDHFFEMANGKWKYANTIVPGEFVLTKDGAEEVVTITDAGKQETFDFHINHEYHRYYTNDISSHNSGAGKSLFLANLGVNFALAGLNVVYLTLELSEALVSMRIDSMLTGISTRNIFKDLDDVEMKVKIIGKKSGLLQVKYMPSGKTSNDVRAYLKEFEIKTGKKVDVLLVDYLDLLMPIGKKISAENLFIKDKYVSEELRNLAMEKQCVFVTAAQLNRGAVEEAEFDHSHISGGLSKIQTADNVFGIFTSRAMRERGRYQIQLMKTRSSSGVGQKIDLEFNIDTLRISDLPEGEQESNAGAARGTSSVIENIKRKTSVTESRESDDPSDGAPVGKVRATVQSSKVRDILNSMNDE